MTRVDLWLGSDIGLWVAETVDPSTVGVVTTEDPTIQAVALSRGMTTSQHPTIGWRALSVHYLRIVSSDVLDWYAAVYNLHPGLLPWGRGHFPLVWAIANREPAGATLHRMVEKVDAGPIVDQTEIAVTDDDTAGSLHGRIREAERELFSRWWPRLLARESIPDRPQVPGGSYHDKAAFEGLLATMERDDRLTRALTFPGKPSSNANDTG